MSGKVIPLSDAFPARRADQVTTYDLLAAATLGWRANPDTLVGRFGLTVYSRMSNDEQVKAVLNFKRDAITARGWQFAFRDGTSLSEEEQEKRKRVFAESVARMRGSFSDALNTIMTGRAYGFSITEKVYGEIEVDGRTWPAINMLLGRDPLSFRFYTDEFGVLQKIEQQAHRAGVVEVDRKRVIHYVHAPEWDHVYGRSDLREAYRSWYIKDQISNLWPLYLERFAGGFIHASQDSDVTLSTDDFNALKDALAKAKSLGYVITPPGVTLNLFHPATTDAFERAIQHHDLAIAKSLLVPNLLGISQAGGGSYAQSQTQLEAFFWTLNADAARLEECLNEQLFRDLGDQCWDDGEYPVFRFKPASFEQMKWVVTTWQTLLSAKAVIPTEEDEAFLRKLLEMPPRDDSSTQLVDPHAEEIRKEQAQQQADAAAAQAEALKKTPVGGGDTKEFAREAFHTPGGVEHDQKSHGDGGSEASVDPRVRTRAAKLLTGVTKYQGKHLTLKPKNGVEQRDTYHELVRGLDAALRDSGYTLAEDKPTGSRSEVNRTYQGGKDRVTVSGRGRPIEANPNASSLRNSQIEFVIDVMRFTQDVELFKHNAPVLYVAFADEPAAAAWLGKLRAGDAIELHEAYAFGEPPDDEFALPVVVHVAHETDELPAGARLVVTRKKGTRLEVRYDAPAA